MRKKDRYASVGRTMRSFTSKDEIPMVSAFSGTKSQLLREKKCEQIVLDDVAKRRDEDEEWLETPPRLPQQIFQPLDKAQGANLVDCVSDERQQDGEHENACPHAARQYRGFQTTMRPSDELHLDAGCVAAPRRLRLCPTRPVTGLRRALPPGSHLCLPRPQPHRPSTQSPSPGQSRLYVLLLATQTTTVSGKGVSRTTDGQLLPFMKEILVLCLSHSKCNVGRRAFCWPAEVRSKVFVPTRAAASRGEHYLCGLPRLNSPTGTNLEVNSPLRTPSMNHSRGVLQDPERGQLLDESATAAIWLLLNSLSFVVVAMMIAWETRSGMVRPSASFAVEFLSKHRFLLGRSVQFLPAFNPGIRCWS